MTTFLKKDYEPHGFRMPFRKAGDLKDKVIKLALVLLKKLGLEESKLHQRISAPLAHSEDEMKLSNVPHISRALTDNVLAPAYKYDDSTFILPGCFDTLESIREEAIEVQKRTAQKAQVIELNSRLKTKI